MTFLRIVIALYLLLEHDLFRKPVPTFRDHAIAQPHARSQYFFGQRSRTPLADVVPTLGF
jgi:hypothetical protein